MAGVTTTVPNLADVIAKVMHREEALEIVFTDHTRVACDGPGGALGHPRTFYSLGDHGYAECGYCDRVFVYDPSRAGQQLEGAAALALAAPKAS